MDDYVGKWHIPAKTFLLGEYAALANKSSIILSSAPYFEISLTNDERLVGIHPSSPAGLWWLENKVKGRGLLWNDPYKGIGGLGASSAQFVGCYLAVCNLKNEKPSLKDLLDAYYHCAWSGKGLRPSGYDILAQCQHGCVYINKEEKQLQTYSWPFHDLAFILIHTGVKLATHDHLKNAVLPQQMDYLSYLVKDAQVAFENSDSERIINSIEHYHEQLMQLNLVAEHSQKLIATLKTFPGVLAVKGCGAMGADILLVITAAKEAIKIKNELNLKNWHIIATEENLTNSNKIPIVNNLF